MYFFNVFEYVNVQTANKKWKLLVSSAVNMSGT